VLQELRILSELEKKLSRLHNREHVCMVGNATIGISLILQAAGIKGKRIAIPNNVCINVPMGIYFSGNQPLFLDICKDDFGINPDLLTTSIDKVDAVLAVHAYGMPCKIKQIEAICRNNDVFLIEDFAVAQGGKVNGKSVGRFGDASVVSFGAGKIIDIGHGGAILTDDEGLAKEIKALANNLLVYNKTKKNKIDQFGIYHTKLYNDSFGKDLEKSAVHFKKEAIGLLSDYSYQFDTTYTSELMSELNDLSENVENRLIKNQKIVNQLNKFDPSFLSTTELPNGSVPWRTNLLIHSGRNQLLKLMLDCKFKISSWHPSVNQYFDNRKSKFVNTPMSDWLGDIILNIWCDKSVDELYIKNITLFIAQNLIQGNHLTKQHKRILKWQ